MKITQDKHNDFDIIALEGEIDLSNSTDLRKVFAQLLKNNTTLVLIDMAGVGFIDSSGIATIVEFMQNLDEKNGEMYLVGITDKVRGILEITKLDKVFSIFSSRDEVFALKYVGS